MRSQERGATVPVSRPGALLRHPQESNPEVIREVSVGRSEKRSLSDEACLSARCTHTEHKFTRKRGRKNVAENAEEEKKEEQKIGLPLIFPASFRSVFGDT